MFETDLQHRRSSPSLSGEEESDKSHITDLLPIRDLPNSSGAVEFVHLADLSASLRNFRKGRRRMKHARFLRGLVLFGLLCNAPPMYGQIIQRVEPASAGNK